MALTQDQQNKLNQSLWVNKLFPQQQYKPTLMENYLNTGVSPTQQVSPVKPTVYGTGVTPQQTTGGVPSPMDIIRSASVPQQQEVDYDALYAPLFSSLAGQEETARTGLAATEAELGTQKGQRLSELATAKGEQQNVINRQREDIGLAEQSALGQARRAYNELMQNQLARWGTGSSTGVAANELLNRSTAEQMGNISTQSERSRADIRNEENRLEEFSRNETIRISNDYDNARLRAQQEFRNRLDQINSQRSTLEVEKAAKRTEAFQAMQAAIAQMDQWKLQSTLSLSLWQEQQRAMLAKSFETMPSGLTADQVNAAMGTYQAAPPKILAATRSDRLPASRQTLPTYAGYYKKPEDYLTALNPYA